MAAAARKAIRNSLRIQRHRSSRPAEQVRAITSATANESLSARAIDSAQSKDLMIDDATHNISLSGAPPKPSVSISARRAPYTRARSGHFRRPSGAHFHLAQVDAFERKSGRFRPLAAGATANAPPALDDDVSIERAARVTNYSV